MGFAFSKQAARFQRRLKDRLSDACEIKVVEPTPRLTPEQRPSAPRALPAREVTLFGREHMRLDRAKAFDAVGARRNCRLPSKGELQMGKPGL